jgi:hypothetical protein
MFAKLARRNFSRNLQHGNLHRGFSRNPAAVRPCNDNQPRRTPTPTRQARRPLLLCRWKQTATGRLECRWESDNPGRARPTKEEGISRPASRRAPGDLVWMAAAAAA